MSSTEKQTPLTPMLRQYHEIKKQYPGTLLFFRLGDFYELFFEDALLGSKEMEITLTARHKDSGISKKWTSLSRTLFVAICKNNLERVAIHYQIALLLCRT